MNKKIGEPVLEAKGISKSFPGVQALDNVDFTLRRGQVHGLMGENGAGKSTLIKVITGLYSQDSGDIIFDGESFRAHSPLHAAKSGISTVYQEINLVPTLSVAENIFIGRQPLKLGQIDWTEMNKRAKEVLRRLDIDIDVTQDLNMYSVAIQQMVSIARALDIQAKVLILDEPTSSLDQSEVDQLFSVIRKLKEQGLGIIFVTHFLDQVFEISDSMTVLRNGRLVGEYETKSLDRMELITKMLGKELAGFEHGDGTGKGKKVAKKELFFEVKDMEKVGTIDTFDLDIYKGEVLGFAGLLGSGRTEIARLLYGIDKPSKGKSKLKGKDASINSPRKALDVYFGFCPEDRKTQGIIPDMTVRENIVLALQARLGIFKYLPMKKQKEITENFIKALSIKTPGTEQNLQNLSGGNQQKVIVARWLASNPEFLILDEPTRGIDVGAKVEIQKLIMKLSNDGLAVLFISSELEEIIRCSNRVVVLRDRKKIAEISGDEISGKNIMQKIASGAGK